MNYLKQNHLSILIIVFLVVSNLFGGSIASFGAATAANITTITNPWRFSSGGTPFSKLFTSTCNLLGMDVSQLATTSAPYDCAVTGVVSGDAVFASLSTTTISTNINSWAVISAKASTTAGFITVRVSNFTGAAAVPSVTSVGSSTQYLIIHPVSASTGI